MNLNPHFRDILHALSDAGAEFLVVGAYAISFHGIPRATGDIDLFVRPSLENAHKVWEGLARFGAPLSNLTEEELSKPDLIFRMGREPNGIDLMTEIDGVDFATAWQNARQLRSMVGPSHFWASARSWPTSALRAGQKISPTLPGLSGG